MGKYINPFSDWGFKRLFGQELTKDLLIHFLNALLKGERKILDLTFKDKERPALSKEERGIIFDIYCTTDTGEHIIVEMQNRRQEHFVKRSVFYASRTIVDQGQKGKWDYDFSPVYTVCFLNYQDLNAFPCKFRTDVALMDRDSHEQVTDCERFIYLALPLFNEKEEDCDTQFEQWIYVLKHMEALERVPFTTQSEIFRKLSEIADITALSKEEREKYDESIKVMRDNFAIHQTAVKDGIAQGIAQGEAKERIKNARAMKAEGIPAAVIARITGLSLEEIEEL
ncbi:hypothetical protein EVA_21348 [gut metagenome]|uniref:Rpn family recombination-promoting nuclease/putative transposase n=1 Tax=gut metagenome TaxID=749906 RepID=J9FT81_9ZZZZ